MAKLQSGTIVYGNLTVNTFANINGNLILGAQVYAAGSPGTNGQVLQNVGGTGVAWANPTAGTQVQSGTSNIAVLSSGSNVVISVGGAIIANVGSTGLTIIGGVAAGTFTGNGAGLTGLASGYSNVQVATYLPTYAGTITATLINVTTTTANTVTSVFTHGSDGNFQLSAQNGYNNGTGAEVARFGLNYSGTGWNSFTQYIRGSGAQDGYQSLWAGNAPIANVTSTGLTVTGIVNASGNILSTGAIHNALTVNGVINSTGNLLSTGAIHNSLNVNGATTITDTAGVASSTTVFNVKNGVFGVAAYGRLGSGNYNPLVGTDDCAIVATGGAGQGSGNLFIGPWSINNTGIRITGNTGLVQIPGQMTINANNSPTAIANGGTNGLGNIGAVGATFNTIFGKATTAQYADLAEIYTSDKNYVPGTVLIFGGDKEVTISTVSHDPRVAGVVSTNPAYLMNSTETGVEVALTGRVPCQVLGPVEKGDRLVSSQWPGIAQRLNSSLYEPGCIIGKALESIDEARVHTIEVVVGRV